MARSPRPYTERQRYLEAFEKGALEALDFINDERPDLEDLTIRTAEHIGRVIDNLREEPDWWPES